jgi:hypothetical protein
MEQVVLELLFFLKEIILKKGASLIAPFFHVLQVPAKALQELLLPSWILFPGFKQCKQCIF